MYLIVAEAEDGTWFDEPDTVVDLDGARMMAHQRWDGKLPRGYEVLIYKLDYVECVAVSAALAKAGG
mgnify:CR=1 FL=1